MHRRRVLAGVATAAGAGLAGCTSLPTLCGNCGGNGSDRPFRPAGRWALAPDAATDAPAGYSVRALAPSAALEASAAVTPAAVRSALGADSLATRQVDPAALDRVIEVRTNGHAEPTRYRALDGDVEPDAITAGFSEGAEAAAIGSHAGYDLYDTGGGGWAYALRDGRAIEVNRLRGATEMRSDLEAVVDVGQGDADRLAATHHGFRDLAGRLEPGHWASATVLDPAAETDVQIGQFRGTVASGATATVDGETASVTYVLRFEDRAALEAAALSEYAAGLEGEDGIASVETATDGRVAEFAAAFDHPAPFVDG